MSCRHRVSFSRTESAYAMAGHCPVFALLLLVIVCGICSVSSLKCRADDEVTFDEDYRDAVRVCMSNLTNEHDEQGYRPDDSGGGNSNGGGNKRPRPKGDSNGSGGNRRPGRPNRGSSCDSGSYGGNRDGDRYNNNGDRNNNNNGDRYNNNGDRHNNNGDRYNNNGGHGGGYGGNNGGHNGGGYNNNDGYGGNSGGGYGGGYYGYGGGPNRRGPMQGGPIGGGPIGGGPMGPMGGRPLTLRAPSGGNSGYSGNHDGRIGTALDQVDACIVHCIFRQMLMLNENARPDKGAIINIMTQKVQDRELRDFILESVEECFEYSKSESNRSLYKCDFSKKLALCLEEKAKRHCDDWDDDGSSRGDQRGDRDRGSNNQRPPRQHYVGR